MTHRVKIKIKFMNDDSEFWLNKYLEAPLTEIEREAVIKAFEQLKNEQAFDGTPSFGTGGMRQIVGHGSNRLNPSTIARLSLALSYTLAENYQEKTKVVIGYDSRLSSEDFAAITYRILTKAGIEVKVFNRPTPTPLISYAVRELKAQAGIVITASHNPGEYNGYKVYGEDGGQIVSPLDQQIQNKFNCISFADLSPNHIEIKKIDNDDIIEEEIIEKYIDRLKKEDFVSAEKKKIKVLYSPLHGTGGWVFKRVFAELGFENFHILESQETPDGNFPNTTGLNPEEKNAFTGLIEKGKETGADLLIATDPDADRVGCAVRKGGDYIFLNGNQIGSLLLESIAGRKAKNLPNAFICKTIVTTELQRRIADSYNIKTVETLTGFKFIAEAISQDPENYLFGGEESYGYLPLHWVRDKDSISSAIALAELAETTSLLDALDDLFVRHGLYLEELISVNLKEKGPEFMNDIVNKLRHPADLIGDSIGERSVIDILDTQEGSAAPKTDFVKSIKKSLPNAIVVQYYLEPEGRITIRPSGTEPKVKIYFSLKSNDVVAKENLESAFDQLREEISKCSNDFLRKLGVV